jgi:hypothetical protein
LSSPCIKTKFSGKLVFFLMEPKTKIFVVKQSFVPYIFIYQMLIQGEILFY